MRVGANARVGMFGGFVILPSHFGVPVASHGGNGEPLHTGCRSPSIDSKHRSAAAPKEYVCRDKNSPCCRQSPSDSRPLAVPCRHVLSHFVPGAYFSSNPLTYGASEQSPVHAFTRRSRIAYPTGGDVRPEFQIPAYHRTRTRCKQLGFSWHRVHPP